MADIEADAKKLVNSLKCFRAVCMTEASFDYEKHDIAAVAEFCRKLVATRDQQIAELNKCAKKWADATAPGGWIDNLRKDSAKVAELERQIRECPTCEGSGMMDVVVRVEPPNEREVFESVECAQCHGTAISAWGQALDRVVELEQENWQLKHQLDNAVNQVQAAIDNRFAR